MRVCIVDKVLTIYDTEGGEVRMTLSQLLEFIEVINIATKENGDLRFETLEFTV